MKKFMMVAAAVMGISCLTLGSTAQAGGWGGSNYGHHNHSYYSGHGSNHGWGYGGGYRGYRPPVYRAPAYGVPVYGGYPTVAPAYPYYGAYPGTSFGISTPNFGLFIR